MLLSHITIEKYLNQKTFTIENLILSQHAYDRIKKRGIRIDEVLCSWNSQNNLYRKSRDNRTIYSNYEYGLYIVIDCNTGIIVTIIEMEWRKYRKGRYQLEKKYKINNKIITVPPVC